MMDTMEESEVNSGHNAGRGAFPEDEALPHEDCEDYRFPDAGEVHRQRPVFSEPGESLAKLIKTVTPAKAEGQRTAWNLDSGVHRNDIGRLLQEVRVSCLTV